MFRKRASKATGATATTDRADSLDQLHTFVLSLPWVVERPDAFARSVRMFAVDCEPLDLQRLWLVTDRSKGVSTGTRVEVMLPSAVAERAEDAGLGARAMTMPADRVLVRAHADNDVVQTEALVLAAYECALSERE
jgi:hypothetical protein